MLFHKTSNFLQLLAEKFTKTPEHASLLEKLIGWGKSMIFNAFLRNEQLFPAFGWKLEEKLKHASLLEKLLVSAKSMFYPFSRNQQVLPENLMKTPIHASFLEKLLVSAKWMIFQAFSQTEKLFATFARKLDENADTC